MACCCDEDNELTPTADSCDSKEEKGESCSCGCGCNDVEDSDEDEEEDLKGTIAQIAFSALWLIAAIAITSNVHFDPVLELLIFLPAYLAAGFDVLKAALRAILRGRPFNESFLMSVATLGALLIAFVPGGAPEFAEAVFVMLFYKVGELFEDVASDRSRRSIKALMDIRPDSATVLRDGQTLTLPAKELSVGDIMVVSPGDKIALDGEIIEGTSALDTSALTGESAPRDCGLGDTVLSGSVNLNGVLKIKATSSYQNSTAAKILKLVEGASANKSNSERFISKFARIYTPIVVCAALVLAFVVPLLLGNFEANFATWLLRGLTFLIVSCPCALVVSVPLTFFGGLGAASRAGILIKGSNYLEALSKTTTVAFDKTGTLTKGNFAVTLVHTSSVDTDKLLHLAAHVEAHSKHPIAEALRVAFPDAGSAEDSCEVEDIQELAGKGIIATVNGERIAVGNHQLMEELCGEVTTCCEDSHETIIHVAIDNVYAGHIVVQDVIKEDSAKAISELSTQGVKTTVMLTGDRQLAADEVASSLGITKVMAELLPQDKVEALVALLPKEEQREKEATVYVGDGINDAPVLARADVGVAMGGVGADAAIEAADVVLMDDSLLKLASALRIAKHTMRIATQNVVLALGIKAIILLLAALGLAPMWLAVFGDTGVLMLCVINASRALKVK